MQFEQDVSLLKDLLEKWFDGATLWVEHFNFNPDVSLLKLVIEKGLEPATLWLHLIGVFFSFYE